MGGGLVGWVGWAGSAFSFFSPFIPFLFSSFQPGRGESIYLVELAIVGFFVFSSPSLHYTFLLMFFEVHKGGLRTGGRGGWVIQGSTEQAGFFKAFGFNFGFGGAKRGSNTVSTHAWRRRGQEKDGKRRTETRIRYCAVPMMRKWKGKERKGRKFSIKAEKNRENERTRKRTPCPPPPPRAPHKREME